MMLLRQGNSRSLVEIFRRLTGWRVWLAVLAAGPAPGGMLCRGAANEPAVQPPAKWVNLLSFKRPSVVDAVDPSLDDRWLLSDRQINPQVDEQFVHDVRQPLTEAGVQFCSHILINFDPTCQSLTFHWARIWRGTNQLNRLDVSRVQIGPAAPEMEEMLFHSDKTAILLLDDVRAGDVVDYAYTIEGNSPVMNGKFTGAVALQFPHPVERAVTRLVWPTARRLYLTNHLTEIKPVTLRRTNAVEFTWAVTNAPGLRPEPATPAWYDPYPWVQMSEFQKWPEVSRWALRLFTTNRAPSPELERKIYEWKQLPEPSDQVLTALRYVQEEIRTQGMDEPAASEPAQPSVVLARRYGDAKDKAFLFATMLRALKIEAFPVLVNTRRRQALAELEPSATLFNHVIVQVNLGGQSYWLDPTRKYERGALALRSWPSYGWGLMVGPEAAGLTPIPPCPVQPLTTVTESLNLGSHQIPTTVKIVTVAEGLDADRLRARFATTPREDLERENRNAYARFYPFINSTAPLDYTDDEAQNRIETTESYSLENVWSRAQGDMAYQCRIYAANVADAVVKLEESSRTMPLGVSYPVHQVFRAEAILTTSLPLDPPNLTIKNPAFYFQRTATVVGSKMEIYFEYRSWTDAVAPEGLPDYVRDLNTAADALGYKMVGD
jgi:transglutaminase-like putative cysteine protease